MAVGSAVEAGAGVVAVAACAQGTRVTCLVLGHVGFEVLTQLAARARHGPLVAAHPAESGQGAGRDVVIRG